MRPWSQLFKACNIACILLLLDCFPCSGYSISCSVILTFQSLGEALNHSYEICWFFSHLFHVFHPYFPPLFKVCSTCTELRPPVAIAWNSSSGNGRDGKVQLVGFCCSLLLLECEIVATVNVSPTSDHRVLSKEPSNTGGCCMGFLCLSPCWWVSFLEIFSSKFWYFSWCK